MESGKNIINLELKDNASLYEAYMPYVSHGGVFIKTDKRYGLGDEVFLMMDIVDEPEKLAVAGKVVWITPAHAQGNKPAGIGVQFTGKNFAMVRQKLETLLLGSLQSERPTLTM